MAALTYYIHPVIIIMIRLMYKEIPNTLLFLLTLLFTRVLGLLICKVNNPTINKLVC